ncbi:MAG: hypothetical protein IEMM0008_1221 [bacterium]|nr:MAG: hypothetical protein IEMM0008_1221 [bacterium]
MTYDLPSASYFRQNKENTFARQTPFNNIANLRESSTEESIHSWLEERFFTPFRMTNNDEHFTKTVKKLDVLSDQHLKVGIYENETDACIRFFSPIK